MRMRNSYIASCMGTESGRSSILAMADLNTRDDVQQYIRQIAQSLGVDEGDDRVAQQLDRQDPLAHLRSCFHIPSIGQLLDERERSSSTYDFLREFARYFVSVLLFRCRHIF